MAEGIASSLLTEHEDEAASQAGLLYTYIARNVVAHGPAREADLAELAAAIHVIQRMIMGQAAARAYPGRYRLLGDVVPAAEHIPPPNLPSSGEDTT